MVLHDGIQDGPTAGICTEDQLHSAALESFISTVNWEEVQIATSSDEHMLLLLSTKDTATNSENTYTVQMVSSSTKIEL